MNHQSVVEFIKSKFPGQDFIPLHVPTFIGNEKNYVLDTIESTIVSSVGAYVNKFEEDISKRSDTKKGIAVVNGTAALQMALTLAGVKQGEEVITQALTFVATANSVLYCGAVPVFVDVDKETMGLSANALETFLSEYGDKCEEGTFNKKTGKRIAACLPMHTFGFMTQIEEIIRICNLWNIAVVEDAAEALGSTYKGKQAGSFGLLGVFSFNGNKTITCGGGGAIVTNDVDLGKRGKHLTTTAKTPHSWEYNHDELGYNFRMPNINAALACAQLEQFDKLLDSKKQLFDEYNEYCAKNGLKLRQPPKNSTSNNWLICLELDSKKERDKFLKFTNENGVMSRPIWKLMYKLPMYSHCYRDDQANAQYFEERIINIPSSARIK